jgi:hypothetical protein
MTNYLENFIYCAMQIEFLFKLLGKTLLVPVKFDELRDKDDRY